MNSKTKLFSRKIVSVSLNFDICEHARIQREGKGVWTPPEKLQNIVFLSNTGPDPLKNHKATKPSFNTVYLVNVKFSNILVVSLCVLLLLIARVKSGNFGH